MRGRQQTARCLCIASSVSAPMAGAALASCTSVSVQCLSNRTLAGCSTLAVTGLCTPARIDLSLALHLSPLLSSDMRFRAGHGQGIYGPN